MAVVPRLPIKEYKKSHIKRELPHIGQGTFGIVYRGTVKDRKNIVAIKDIKVKDNATFDEWKKEVEFMSFNTHKYIVEIYGYYCSPEMLTIVMEYLEGGMLFDLLHDNPGVSTKLTYLDRLRMARHITIAVAFLHSHKVIHRDVKTMNVLVGKNWICKLSDFGSAKISIDQNMNTAGKGTPFWMAPEVMFNQPYSLPADIYSLGIVFYELFEKKLPQYDHDRRTILLESYNFMSSGIILPMLNLEPTNRPSSMNIAERLDFILRMVLYQLDNNIGFDQSLDDWFVNNGYVSTPNNGADQIICKLLHEKFEPNTGNTPQKPSRPAPQAPSSSNPRTSNRPRTQATGENREYKRNLSRRKLFSVESTTEDNKSEDDCSEDYLYEKEYEKMTFTPQQILRLSEDYTSDNFTVKKNEELIFEEQSERWIRVTKPGHSLEGWINLDDVKIVSKD